MATRLLKNPTKVLTDCDNIDNVDGQRMATVLCKHIAGYDKRPDNTRVDRVLGVDAQGDVRWTKNIPGGGGSESYTAGNGIEIENNQISVDTDVVATKSDLPDMSEYATESELTDGLASKQDVISDLSTIRSGASAGATAVQPGSLATVATTGAYADLSGTPTIPSVDQSYNSASTNPQSGTAVAQAISAALGNIETLLAAI